MNVSLLAHKDLGATLTSRISPVSLSAGFLTVVLATLGLVSSLATKFNLASLPNIVLMVTGVVVLDVVTQFAPQTRIVVAAQTILYAVLYLMTTCVFGILAAYSMQRFAFPLQDEFLANADRALGFNWLDYAHWVDRHVAVQAIFHKVYDSIFLQVSLPLVVLAVSNRINELRVYLLALAVAFTCTIIVSALMPAAGPIAFADRSTFDILRFTGATPLDHLMRLREAGPLVMNDHPGGIATFPSFHATIAIMTPLALRGYPRMFVILLIVNAAMLGATLTEGAHYLIDIIAGTWMAFFGYAMAKRIIRLEDRLLRHRAGRPVSREQALQAA
jgi:membrane-associated phospholipid phosphatase